MLTDHASARFVLFDLDGTLIDPGPGIIGSAQQALKELGRDVPPARDLEWIIGPPLRQSFARLLGSGDLVEKAVELYRAAYGNVGITQASCSIPDDHISPRRSALFMARLVLRDIRDGAGAC